MLPYGRQDIQKEDIDSVISVLESDYLTQGPIVPKFEEAICEYAGASFGVTANSATSCLHIACMALDLSKGDILWTSPITFVASSNCALYCDATVDFVDIDPVSFNICPIELKNKLEKASLSGELPKILVAVHMAGQSPEMKEIFNLSKEYGFKIIEDASHAIGGSYLNSKIGNCRFSDVTIFSFHPVKIITTLEGGIALTNCKDLASKMSILRTHGVTRDHNMMENHSHGDWYYEQIDLGYNYRMTDLQAALGISQLTRIDSYIEKRHEIASIYNNELSLVPLDIPIQHPDTYSSFHLYIIQLDLSKLNKSHQEIFQLLRKNGLGVNLHYIPVHLHPYYQKLGFKKGDFPKSEFYYKRSISIPIFPRMSHDDINFVISTLKEVIN